MVKYAWSLQNSHFFAAVILNLVSANHQYLWLKIQIEAFVPNFLIHQARSIKLDNLNNLSVDQAQPVKLIDVSRLVTSWAWLVKTNNLTAS